ncbi:DJ-1 family glyoxalase III [Thiomicrospira pelophila]|uniref:DJ-1 family glyoxalase III n=1 Tax=Thiomicrospira pelophila TaxID=934 RepID=UPI0004A6C2AF|nr:DJ-1 family glyoxalase III [Thiomicrospira pelophila]
MIRVLVPLAQGCEELEAVTIIDILVRAEIEVVTASLDDQHMIHCSRGVVLQAKTSLSEVLNQAFDMVVLPGGQPGSDNLAADERLLELLRATVKSGGISAAICAAPKALKAAGLLDGLKATSYPGVLDKHPAQNMIYVNEIVVDSGSIVTSRGPGTAMDFALHLIERLKGIESRTKVEAALVRP